MTTEYPYGIFSFSFPFIFFCPLFSAFPSCFSTQNQQIYSRHPRANMCILVLTDYSEASEYSESIPEADTCEETYNIFLSPLILNWDWCRKPLSRQLLNTQVSDPGWHHWELQLRRISTSVRLERGYFEPMGKGFIYRVETAGVVGGYRKWGKGREKEEQWQKGVSLKPLSGAHQLCCRRHHRSSLRENYRLRIFVSHQFPSRT